jgi:hypothetical protein
VRPSLEACLRRARCLGQGISPFDQGPGADVVASKGEQVEDVTIAPELEAQLGPASLRGPRICARLIRQLARLARALIGSDFPASR